MMQHQPIFTGRTKMVLPEQYQPTDDVVIIGRGKKIREHAGNQRFYAVVDANLQAYQTAATKGLKSSILWNILTQVRNQSQNGYGFVKKEGGRWNAVDDACARINIAQAFRDRLSYAYKSSKQHKSIKRKHDLGLLPKSSESSPSPSPVQNPDAAFSTTEDSLMNNATGLSSTTMVVKYDSAEEEEERPSKRICTGSPTSTIMNTPSLESDNEQIGIYKVLQAATKITFNEESALKKADPQPVQDDIFQSLWNKFGSVDTTENPFEPKPINEEKPQQQQEQPMPVKETSSSSSNLVKPTRPVLTASSILQRTTYPMMSSIQKKKATLSPRSSVSLMSLESLVGFNNANTEDIDDDLLGDCIDMVNSLWGN